MAEQVNQRIENMINELEELRRTNLYEDEEIREISRKRKEFEYRIQRRVKDKEDFVHYIAYELALLQDISLRRKLTKMGEKKKDIEYSIAKRLNKLFKQFIHRFQNDLEVYFQYIKFCKCVGFDYAVSSIIGQMLLVHGDKPKMWQLAAKWESEGQNNLENARQFLLKGIQRHPESEVLYLDLFQIELMLSYQADNAEDREKLLKRANIIWRNGIKNISSVKFLFELCDLSLKYEITESITGDIKREIWKRNDEKAVWSFIASKELEGIHWNETEEFLNTDHGFPIYINNYMVIYEEALQRFPDENLCTKYIYGLLGLDNEKYTDILKVNVVKHAWMYGHKNGVLSNDMYLFGIKMLKLEDVISESELIEILDTAIDRNPHSKDLWEEKLIQNKSDDSKVLSILQNANKVLSTEGLLQLWNAALDNAESDFAMKNLYKKCLNCENAILLALKPKLLKKMYQFGGIKGARGVYEEFVRTPPLQIDIHKVMIELEKTEEKPNVKYIRKCFEYALQQNGKNNVEVWTDYIKYELENGNAQGTPAIYRRAVGMLDKELVDKFINTQVMSKLD